MGFKEIAARTVITASLLSGPAVMPTSTVEAQIIQPDGREKLEDLVRGKVGDGLRYIRDKFQQTGQMDILQGLCIGWLVRPGLYTVSVNPGIFVRQSKKEFFSFFVVTSDVAANTPQGSAGNVGLTSGPVIFERFDSHGKTIKKSRYIDRHVEYALDGKPVRGRPVSQVKPEVRDLNGILTLVNKETGEKVIASKSFEIAEGEQKDFLQMCQEAVA